VAQKRAAIIIQALLLQQADAAILEGQERSCTHDRCDCGLVQVDALDTAMEIGSAFDDIVDHPIMGREWPRSTTTFERLRV